MTRKIKNIEKDIFECQEKLAIKKSKDPYLFIENLEILDLSTNESLSETIKYFEKERQFALEEKARKIYNQDWFKVLLGALVGALITKFIK